MGVRNDPMILTLADVSHIVTQLVKGYLNRTNVDVNKVAPYIYGLVRASRNDAFPAALEWEIQRYQRMTSYTRPKVPHNGIERENTRLRQEGIAIEVSKAAVFEVTDDKYTITVDDVNRGIRKDADLHTLLRPYMDTGANNNGSNGLVGIIDNMSAQLDDLKSKITNHTV